MTELSPVNHQYHHLIDINHLKMLFSKEKFTLIFVLISCLMIAIFSPGLINNKQIENNNKVVEQNKNEDISLFKNIWGFSSKDTNEQIEDADSIISIIERNDNIQNTEEANPQNNTISIISIESVLSGIENLSSNLKLEFENIKEEQADCPTCTGTESSSEIIITPDSTCATIISVGGGACNCASLGCTPPNGPWCVHPCCCVCCAACCR